MINKKIQVKQKAFLLILGVTILFILSACTSYLSPRPSANLALANVDCNTIKGDKDAMVECLRLKSSLSKDYCNETNKNLCYFGLAIVKSDLNLCSEEIMSSDEQTECKIIVQSYKNTCEHWAVRKFGPSSPFCRGSSPTHLPEIANIIPTDCNKITLNSKYQSPSYRNRCLMGSAFSLNDQRICQDITEKPLRQTCLIGTAESFQSCNDLSAKEKMWWSSPLVGEALVRDECFRSLAIRTKNMSMCTHLTDYAQPSVCIYSISSKNNIDPSECTSFTSNFIDLNWYGTVQDACYLAIAESKGDIQLCNLITTAFVRASCIGSMGTVKDCEKISATEKAVRASTIEGEEPFARDECILKLVERFKDMKYCEQTISPRGFDNCLHDFGRLTGDKEICDLIKDKRTKESCKA